MIFLRFFKCYSLETIEMRLDVRIAWMLTFLRKYLAHLLKIQHSSARLRKSNYQILSFISLMYWLKSSVLKNLKNIEALTYFLPLLTFMNRIVIQKKFKILQAYSMDFFIKMQHLSTTFSDFYLLLKNEQNWLIMFDQLFFLALKISFQRVFSILLLEVDEFWAF